MSQAHIPVMLSETLEGLKLQPGEWYVDATFGAGGHSRALLSKGVKVLAIDQDPAAKTFEHEIREELNLPMQDFYLQTGNFRNLDKYVQAKNIEPLGVLLDLGVSSMQLDQAERGFAFRQDGPLDMRMSQQGESAADVVNSYSQEDLAALIYKYGEERFSRRIAREIVSSRPIHTTDRLVEIIQKAYPGGARRDHPARRTFQALRIYVNDELGALESALTACERVLQNEGRLVVMSYHSLEDRIVKQFVRGSEHMSAVTKKPLTAAKEEADQNPRSRSAKLRVAERVSQEQVRLERVQA